MHTRTLSRLIAGLFAVQLIAAGFCLVMPEAHAAASLHSIADAVHQMPADGHCAQPAAISESHGTACVHCPQAEVSAQQYSAPIQAGLALAPAFLSLTRVVEQPAVIIPLAARTPTGPPHSASLIYTTTQRIRI